MGSDLVAALDDLRSQRYYYGARAGLKTGDVIRPGPSADADARNESGAYVTFVDTVDAAAWEAERTLGDGPGRIYTVQPTGAIERDDQTESTYPASLGRSYRSPEPLRVTGECTNREGHPRRLYHGTKAELRPGDLIEPGHSPNFGSPDRTTTYVYLTGTLDAAKWGAELALGDGRGRIYIVEPTGPITDDPNLTNARFRGNPTKSYRTRKPLRVVGEVMEWQGHSLEALRAMKDGLERLKHQGVEPIDD